MALHRHWLRSLLLIALLAQGGGASLVHRLVAHGPDAADCGGAHARDCGASQAPGEPADDAGDEPAGDDCPVCDMLGTLVAAPAVAPRVLGPAVHAESIGTPSILAPASSARCADRARAPPVTI